MVLKLLRNNYKNRVTNNDINDTELFDAKPRLLVFDVELRLSFT